MSPILAALMMLTCAMSQAGLASDDSASGTIGYENTVVSYLRPLLRDIGGAARIYYAGECRAAEYDTSGKLQLRFPGVSLHTPSPGATGIDAIRQIFREDPKVAVVQDRSGMVRIVFGSPSTTVLQAGIRTLSLNPYNQYSAPSATAAIEGAPELLAAERRLGVFPNPLEIIDTIVSGPIPGAPHLPKLIQNVSVDEALDSVARTFKGIVTYGICKPPDAGSLIPNAKGLFQLGFVYGS